VINIIKPKPLKKGDIIAIVAPASPLTKSKVSIAKNYLEKLGFYVIVGKSCYCKHGYLAGNDLIRAYDINQMFLDDEVKAIICLRGGYGTARILDLLDFESIKKHPKVFIGYSDITTLHIAFNKLCNMVTFHGPMAVDISNGLDDFTKESFLSNIQGNTKGTKISNPIEKPIKCKSFGITSGEIIGGNLTLINSTLGTPYEIDTRNKILFIEEVGERPYKIDRLLTQLYYAGKLDDANGIIIGNFKNCEPLSDEASQRIEQVFNDIIKSLNKPTIYNVQSGHCKPMITIPFGLNVYMDAERCQIIIKE
jgi:muramoyltetrapeptide carboxypeptidase